MPIPRTTELIEALQTFVEEIISSYAKVLVQMALRRDPRELENPRHPVNFLSEIDMELSAKYSSFLRQLLPSFVYASEEEGPYIWPDGQGEVPELLVIVDPLDTSELAVRGLHGYTHVTVYSLLQDCPLVTVVGDMFHFVRLYWAYRTDSGKQAAFLKTSDLQTYPLQCGAAGGIESALVTNYLMRPIERFKVLAAEQRLIDALGQAGADGISRGRIGVDFGSVGLCHVASGFTDAMVEFAKGFALWDLFPGQHVLEAAGGVVTDLDGTPLQLRLGLRDLKSIRGIMDTRQKFVAAGSSHAATTIASLLGEHKAPGEDGKL